MSTLPPPSFPVCIGSLLPQQHNMYRRRDEEPCLVAAHSDLLSQSVVRPLLRVSSLTRLFQPPPSRFPPRSADGRTSGRTCSERRRRRRLGRQTRPYTAAATRRCSRRQRRLARRRRRRHPTFGRVLGGRSGERSDARALAAADGDGYGASCLSPSPPPPTLHALALPPPRSPCSLAEAAMALAWRSQLLLPPHME